MNTEKETSVRTKQVWMLVVVLQAWIVADGLAAQAQNPGETFWSIAPHALTDHDLRHGTAEIFQPLLQVSDWTGNLVHWRLDADGEPVASDWNARAVMAEREVAASDYWKSRHIILIDEAGNEAPFLWDSLSRAQQAMLDSNSIGQAGPYASPVLNYLRGDRSAEAYNGFRKRGSLLGDIMHSVPVHVGMPAGDHDKPPLRLASYSSFREEHRDRKPRVYVGANDGMLHAFDAASGEEAFAYIPSMIDYAQLATLAERGYRHAAFVDGALVAADVERDEGWATLLAGGLGAGGEGVYLLDITHAGEGAALQEGRILAELGPGDRDLGHINGAPSFALLEDDNWYLVTGNGFGSANARAVLYLIPLATDASIRQPRRIVIPDRGSTGLASPALIDTDGNGRVDRAYAGDQAGNLWRFDLARHRVEEQPLFSAGASRPIVLQPEVAEHPERGYMVYVATGGGRAVETVDDNATQAIVALHDTPGRNATIHEDELDNSIAIREVQAHGKRLRIAEVSGDNRATRGWKVELPLPGERVPEPPLLHAGRLQFISSLADPDDSNGMPGNWFMELDWLDGGGQETPSADYSGDGLLDANDAVQQDGTLFHPVGEYLGNALYSALRVARLESGMNAVLVNAIRIESPAGIAGGTVVDMDADTRRHGLGGATAKHSHGYDAVEPASRTIDYFDLKAGQQRHFPIASDYQGDFLITLANADLSPGGDLLIAVGERERRWRLMDFQVLMQQRLQTYDGSVAPSEHFTDDTGFPLLYSSAGTGRANRLTRLEIHLDPRAVSRGGMHATLPRCVSRDTNITHGRWRNGALTMQLHTAQSLDDPATLQVQQPDDLASLARGYGGMHANPGNDSGFLYESAIYWHYPGKACYGEEKWGVEVAAATGVASEAVIFALLDDGVDLTAENLAEILDAIATIAALECEGGKGFDCHEEEEYRQMESILDELLDLDGLTEAAMANGGMLQLPGVEGLLAEQTVDASRIIKPKSPPKPAAVDRRRAWIDIEQ